MQNDFDNHIKKQVDEFKLSPSPQIWDLVEAQLPEKKSKRFIFWWFPLGMLLIGLGIYGLIKDDGKNKNINTDKKIVATKEVVKKDSVNNLIIIKKLNKEQNKSENKIATNNGVQTINNYLNKKQKLKNITSSELRLIDKNSVTNNEIVLNNGEIKIINETQKSITKQKENNSNIIENNLEDEKIVTELKDKKDDSIINKLAQKEIDTIERDTAIQKNKIVKNKKNPTKVKWEVSAEIGNSNTVGKAFGINGGSAYNVSNNLSASPGNGSTTITFPLSSPTAGISVGFNLQRTRQVTKSLSWFGSIGYRYLSNHQSSGVFVDSSKIIGGDSALLLSSSDKVDKVSNYYKYGATLNHTNYVHLLNIAVGLKYNLNKAFSISGGIMVGYQVKYKWLQPDTKQSILYYSDKLTNKWNIGTKIGFDWQAAKSFSIGIFYNYSFSNTSLAEIQQNLHWQSVGAKISIQLPFKK